MKTARENSTLAGNGGRRKIEIFGGRSGRARARVVVKPMKRQLGLTRAFRGKISDRSDIKAPTSHVMAVADS